MTLNWDDYCPASGFDPERFDKVTQKVVELARHDVRGRILHSMVPFWTTIRMAAVFIYWFIKRVGRSERFELWMNRVTSTGRLEEQLRKRLLGDAVLKDLGDPLESRQGKIPRPFLWILATNLSKNCLCSFSFEGFSNSIKTPTNVLGDAEIPVARAVACSAAFPGFFSAMPIVDWRVVYEQDSVDLSEHHIVDGGVLDNLGIDGYLALTAHALEKHLLSGKGEQVIVSDATGQIQIARASEGRTLGFALPTALRSIDIGTVRLSKLQQKNLLEPILRSSNCPPSINAEITEGIDTGLAKDVQQQLPAIRTDFDRFNDTEIACLIRHGYAIMWKHIRARLEHVPREGSILGSCSGMDLTASASDPGRTRQVVQNGAKRRLGIVRPRLAVAYANIGAILLIAAGLWLAAELRKADALAKFESAHQYARMDRWKQAAAWIGARAAYVLTETKHKKYPGPFRDGPDLSSVSLLKMQRLFDLRRWRDVRRLAQIPPIGSDAASAETLYVRMQLKKLGDATKLWLPFSTNGDGLFIQGPLDRPCEVSEANADETKPHANRQSTLCVDIHDIALNEVFEIVVVVTYWNGLQEAGNTFVGVPVWCENQDASLGVLWPDEMARPEMETCLGSLAAPEGPDECQSSFGELNHDARYGFTVWTLPPTIARGSVAKLKWTWPEGTKQKR